MKININSVKSKLIAIQLPILVFIVVIIGVLIYSRVNISVNKQQADYLKLSSQDAFNGFQIWLDERINEAKTYAINPVFKNALASKNFSDANKLINVIFENSKMASGNYRLESVFVANSEGVILAEESRKAVGLDLKTIPSYAPNVDAAKKGNAHISQTGISPASGRPVSLVTAPILDGDKLVGIIGLPIEVSVIKELFITNQKFGETGYVFLLDAGGLIIAHPDKTMVGRNIQEFDFGKGLINQKEGDYSYTYKGAGKTGHMKYLQSVKWIVVSGIENQELRVVLNEITFVTAAGVIVGGILIFFLIFFISVWITKPLKRLKDASECIAQGDIEVLIDINRKDEMGELANAFKKMVAGMKKQADAIEQLAEGDLTIDVEVRSQKDIVNKSLSQLISTNNQVFSEIRNAAEQVEAAASQVAAGSQSAAQAATEQASTVEEINASIEEIAEQSKGNANNSRKANDLVVNANDRAQQGAIKMSEMSSAMNDIYEASGSISKIIKVIEEIAFQTNILALNAAVEAARAGVHGKGFAVVAEEVRNLAARSSEAAKETTELIEGTIRKTEKGTAIAKDTESALRKITEMILEVAGTIETISNASSQQAIGVSQITQAISQVAGTTQTNSATAEESAAASQELSGQAAMLREAVSKFKIKQDKMIDCDYAEKRKENKNWQKNEANGYLESGTKALKPQKGIYGKY